MILSLKDLDVKGKRILMRVDFNVPLNDDGSISDDTRITLALPSIQYVLKEGGKLILMSHFGRPKGKVCTELSLKPCADRLSALLKKEVLLAPDAVGKEVETMTEALQNGAVMMLENLRFHLGEEAPEKDPSFAASLAKLGDCYVDDAFGAAHRAHASTVTVPSYFPEKCAMGFLMEKEIAALSKLVSHPKHPFYAIIGGAKIKSKIGVLRTLSEKVDALFIGGGMAFTFFKVLGMPIGDSICDDERLEEAKTLLTHSKKMGMSLHLPFDVVITDGSEIKTVEMKEGIPKGWKGMDVGPKTIAAWSNILKGGTTIFWNGPVGVFEDPSFAKGTNGLAQNLSTMPGEVIVGGGDSIAAINRLHLQNAFAHLSSGGGASLEFIENGTLPGIEALRK